MTVIFLYLFFYPKIIYPARSWKYYFKKGSIQFRYEMYDYSLFNMIKALEINPKLYKAANILAEIYKIKNKNLTAIEYYKISLKINSEQPETLYRLGKLYEFYFENKKAFSCFKDAVKFNPSHIKANLSLVRHFIRENNKKLAHRHFMISYNLSKKNSWNNYLEALEAEKKDNIEKAVKIYETIIINNPALIEAYKRLYEIHRKNNKFVKAVKYLEKLKFVKPDYEMAYISLGHIYFSQKLPGKRKHYIDLAIKNLKKAIKINPKNYDTYMTLSRIYQYIGMNLEAEKMKKKASEAEQKQ